jgi:hypothetical protein
MSIEAGTRIGRYEIAVHTAAESISCSLIQ